MTDGTIAAGRRDFRIIGLVSTAHGCSHFFQLMLPPLFPLLKLAYGVSYTDLGVMMTTFFVTSGLTQAPWGFVVDRWGGRVVLIAGLAVWSSAAILMGLVTHFWMMLPCVMLAGLGNSVFHPADYSILTARVSPRRLGRAYGIHTLGGSIGFALSPVVMLGLTSLIGWRMALVTVGIGGLIVVMVLAAQSAILADERVVRRERHGAKLGAAAQLQLLMSPVILLCFGYFALLTLSLMGLQTFLPATLYALYGLPLGVASSALTCYLLGSIGGILTGGMLADRLRHHDRLIAGGLFGAAVATLVIALVPLPVPLLFAVVALAGFCASGTNPARDMMVRQAAPAGGTGKVFGFVYSGLDAGAAIGPLILGMFLDHGSPRLVFFFSAASLAVAIGTAVGVRQAVPPRPDALARAAE